MSYDPKAIANYFLSLTQRDKISLSPMKIQKLVYYANGWWLAIKGQPLINEQIEAWTFGPVIPSLYREFREFGNRPITEWATNCEYEKKPDSDGFILKTSVPSVDDDATHSASAKVILDRIWEVYGKFTAIQLSNMTHEENSPWHQVVTKYAGSWPRGTDIPIETIRDYFLKLSKGESTKS